MKHVPDWFPGAGFKRFAKRARARLFQTEDELYSMVKEQVVGRLSSQVFLGLSAHTRLGKWDGPAITHRGLAAG